MQNTAQQLSQIAFANKQKPVIRKRKDTLEYKIQQGTAKYLDYVLAQCTSLAKQGFGSVNITVDKTTQLFGMDEERNACYVASDVITQLLLKGFLLSLVEDHYDAETYKLVWDSRLPHAYQEIGMQWVE